jgi:hypothetical protein
LSSSCSSNSLGISTLFGPHSSLKKLLQLILSENFHDNVPKGPQSCGKKMESTEFCRNNPKTEEKHANTLILIAAYFVYVIHISSWWFHVTMVYGLKNCVFPEVLSLDQPIPFLWLGLHLTYFVLVLQFSLTFFCSSFLHSLLLRVYFMLTYGYVYYY